MSTHLLIWEYFINFMEILLFFLFIHTNLHLNKKISHCIQKQLLYLVLDFIVLCILNQQHITSLLSVAISFALDIIFALLFYDDSIVVRIFCGCMYSVICMLAEAITLFIPQTFSDVSALDLLLGGKLHVPFTLLYIALIAVFVFLFHSIVNIDIFLSPLQKITYIVISIVGLITAHYILLTTLNSVAQLQNENFTSRLITINVSFIVLFLALLLCIYQLGYSKEQNLKLLEQQKLHELEEQEYQNLIDTTTALREIKHDMSIHLDIIQSMAENGTSEELLSYINDYHHTLDTTHTLISTGNTAIDCILSSKLSIASQSDIQTHYSVIAPDEFPIDAISLSSLLGNLWNNAIEACQRLIAQQCDISPSIQFYIKPFQNMILIHIANTYDGILTYDANRRILSQKNESGHGIGIKRISDIVRNADGILRINTENNLFTVHIMIPQKEMQNETICNNT